MQVEIPGRPVSMPNQIGELNNNPLLIPNHSECDVYISQNLKENIWNREFIDFIFFSQIERPQML